MVLIHVVADVIASYWKEILKIGVETFVIYLLIRFRYRSRKDNIIGFPQSVIDKLIDDFDPDGLIKDVPNDMMLPDVYDRDMVDLANFDVFELSERNKDEMVEVIRKYGVGTCGPRGFYGTLDLHLELEEMISKELGAECTIMYPNNFTAINSVISCFCKQQDVVFYHEDCNEAILRGIGLSRSTTIEFKSISDLEIKMEYFIKPKLKNFVIVEGLFRNTGRIIDMKGIFELKRKHKFRIILDESYSIPMLDKRGVCGMNGISIKEIDIVIGSLCHGLCSAGAFTTGSLYTVDYQRLSGSSYCFSASVPGAMVKGAMLNIMREFDYDSIRSIVETFHYHFKSESYEIISSVLSPIVIMMKRKERRKGKSKEMLLKEILDIRTALVDDGVLIGFNHNPCPSLRICLKIGMSDEEVIRISGLLSRW